MDGSIIIQLVISALVPAILVTTLFYYLDKNKEPIKAIVRAFVLGIISIFVLLILHKILPYYGLEPDGSFSNSFWISFWDAGVLEETAKFLVFAIGIYSKKYFDEWYDGILYGVMIGLGFAFIENLSYFFDLFQKRGIELVIVRSIYSMPMHALLGGIMGYYIAKAKFTLNESAIPLFWSSALIIPIIIHGIFDFVLFYNDLDIGFLSIGIVIYMWYKILKLKKETQTTKVF